MKSRPKHGMVPTHIGGGQASALFGRPALPGQKSVSCWWANLVQAPIRVGRPRCQVTQLTPKCLLGSTRGDRCMEVAIEMLFHRIALHSVH